MSLPHPRAELPAAKNGLENSHLITPDVLRGCAVLMVVIYHLVTKFSGASLPWNGWVRDFAHPPARHFYMVYPVTFGWAGVALFFVLSGFCIHLSFLRATAFTWPKFFWQRFWRIYPAYLVALVFFVFLKNVDLHTSDGMKQFGMHALLIHDFSADYMFGINASFWSLATEVQLYLLFPFLIILRQNWGIRGCLVITCAIGLVWRLIVIGLWGLPEGAVTPGISFPLATWFDWTLGAFVAERAYQQRQAFSRHRLWLFILVPVFVVSTLYKPLTAFSFSLAAGISAVVLDLMLKFKWKKSLALNIAVFIGTISYSLYLYHQPLITLDACSFFQNLNFFPRWVLILTTIVALTGFSWFFIERNGIRLGKILGQKYF